MVGRDVREQLVPNRLVVDQLRLYRFRSCGAVESEEVDAGLAGAADLDRPVGRAGVNFRSRLRRVVDDVDRVGVRTGCELICRRPHLRVAAEEGVARATVAFEVTAVAGVPGCVPLRLHLLLDHTRDGRRSRNRLRLSDILGVIRSERLQHNRTA